MNKFAFLLFSIAILSAFGSNGQGQLNSSGYIRAGKFQVYYEREGKGHPVLLLHAGLQDHTMWKEQVKALSLQYDVITPDLPFHGRTTGKDTTLLAQEVIKALLDSLHLEKVSIAGLSMGASVAQDFIIAYPQRVNKAILISAGISGYEKVHPIDSVSADWYIQFAKAIQAGDTTRAAREFTKAWAQGIYRSHDSLKAPVSRYVYSKTLETLQRHKMAGWPQLQSNPPAFEKLSTVKVPVLIIDGDKDLPYIAHTSKYLEETVTGARRVQMKGVAHMLNMEKPEEFNKMLLDFLKVN
jgi:pimeloyl-ACP methyl ester carboxylesterase